MCHALKREKWGPRINQKVSSAGQTAKQKRQKCRTRGVFTQLVSPLGPSRCLDVAIGLGVALQEPKRALSSTINKPLCPYQQLMRATTQPVHIPTPSSQYHLILGNDHFSIAFPILSTVGSFSFSRGGQIQPWGHPKSCKSPEIPRSALALSPARTICDPGLGAK